MAYSYTGLNNPLAGNDEEVVARRQTIDDELHDLQKRMHDLRVERNSLCPIHCLSVELLSRIFLYLGWKPVAGVSRYWRSTALACSPLWNVIDFSSTTQDEHAGALLSRSNGIQLSVYAQQIYAKDIPVLNSLLEDLSRIRRLSIPISHESPTWPQIISKLVASPALSLEYLRIDGSRTDPVAGDSCLIPEQLFSNNAPRLHELEISGCFLDAQSSLYENLTRLKLSGCNPPLSLRGVLKVLERTHHLESLHVNGGFSFSSADQGWQLVDGRPTVFDAVPLPSLKFFSVDCQYSPQSLSLFAHLTLKPDICVEFHGTSHKTPFHTVIQVDARTREKSPDALIKSMSLIIDPRLMESSPLLELNTHSRRTGHSGLLSVHINLMQISEEDYTLWATSLRQLPLSNLCSFRTNIAIPHETWLLVFGHLKFVTDITISGEARPTFVEALVQFRPSDDEDFGTSNPADRFILPGLQTIQMRYLCMTFTAFSFIKSLVCRRRHGLPFKGIDIRHCFGVTSSIIETFETSGINVHWDGWDEDDPNSSETDAEMDDWDDETDI